MAPSLAYPTGQVADGDPLFTRLVPRLRIRAEYAFSSRVAHHTAGTISLTARVSDRSGWTRTLPLAASRPLDGDHAVVEGDLDLRAVQSMVAGLEAVTGTSSDPTITITAVVAARGDVGGLPLRSDSTPEYAIGLNSSLMQPSPDKVVTNDGSVHGSGRRDNSVRLMRASLPVPLVRTLGVLAAGSALAVALLLAVRRRAESSDVVARILRDHQDLLVEASPADVAAGEAIHVQTFDDLLRLASRYERMVLHAPHGADHVFLVDEAGTRYRHTVATSPTRSTREPSVAVL